ncbi:hypothetical protein [Bacillus sp. FSL R9-9497]|uniref:hypothetical protein n=1 Tax=unclassified Bacillus (in: firmicutes) TaxID=185979 RepID=UPI0030F7287B
MNEVVEFFKSYGPIITFIIGITGLGTSLFYFLKNRKQKKLEYVISNKTALFNQLHSKIKIFFNEQEIKEDACLSILIIENIGNEPIKEEEFEKNKPLKINFLRADGTPVRIFDVEIYKANPVDFNIEVDYNDLEGILCIKPTLFNPKDYVTLKLISTEFEQVSISGRIIGGSVVNGEKRKKRKGFQRSIMPLVFSIMFSTIGISLGKFFNNTIFLLLIIGVVITFLGIISAISVVLKKQEKKGNLES